MKFRNPKTGEVFEHTSFKFCGEYESDYDCRCGDCPINRPTDCNKWILANTVEAAKRMGYEVVLDSPGITYPVSHDGAFGIIDTGNRTPMGETGFVRDTHEGKGRMDLLPWPAIIELSQHCEAGALKYGERNIDKGAPLHSLLDSGARHLAKLMSGQTDEDHLRAACWNLMWALNQRTTHPELNDTPWKGERDG